MTGRVAVDGKHFDLEGAPFRVRGVTYGSFVPRLDGARFPERADVKEDFRRMVDAGLNTVRTYDLPPLDVLDIAGEVGLRVLVGIQFHDWLVEQAPGRAARCRVRDAGRREVDRAVDRCGSLPHVLGIAVGNEVPADVVRVHGIASVEDLLSELIERIHRSGSEVLATYVNYPTTEFLSVEGQDFTCFNVFLEDPDALRRYLRHLQVVAGTRPLVVSEIGLGSALHGEAAQTESLRWQLELVDETGCGGAIVFAWTDEWAVEDRPVEGWGFGITDTQRIAKPALDVVRAWADRHLVEQRAEWPRLSVVVCAYNEERTIAECLTSLAACRYPELEVIVCDDGSSDRTLEIAGQFPFRILALDHDGLSAARNAGLSAASGEIVAYLDADAACHPEWPFHLALGMEDAGVVAVGGPNVGFPDAEFVERAVALSPGSPAEVLVTDDRAEHIPGCNMAYRKDALEAIGGFDTAYTAAGDDVDVCWKLLERGDEIAFAPAAQVAHHRRHTIKGYLKQQRGYGRAERMLAGAHPHRFNRLGQARWRGFIYGGARILPSVLRPVVYHGYMGTAPFQPIARRRAEAVTRAMGALIPLSVLVALLGTALVMFVSAWWFVLVGGAVAAVALYGCFVALAVPVARNEPHRVALRATVGTLHVLQPFARTWGRLRGTRLPERAVEHCAWTGDRLQWLRDVEAALRRDSCAVGVGSPDDDWDLQATFTPFVAARITTAVTYGWLPQASVRYAARPSAWVALAVALALPTLIGGWEWGLGCVALVIAALLVNVVVLKARANSAVIGTSVYESTS
jgi:glycosyltransferase involved in cell wall biosynthesis